MTEMTLQEKKILVVDDDPIMVQLVKQGLLQANAEIFTACNGSEGLHQFYKHQPDLVILDIMMPEVDGRDLCRHIRKFSNTPIIMLTALDKDKDIVAALNDGADDYITKPFTIDVLLARAQAVLRRVSLPEQVDDLPISYTDDHMTIDLEQRRVSVKGQLVRLTATEHRLLAYMLYNADQLLTFKQILEHVWGWEYQDNIDYVHVYVSHLRRKLECNPKKPQYLLSEHGIGYRFEKRKKNFAD